jgi:tetratricopeptide (TPR) repeat protein
MVSLRARWLWPTLLLLVALRVYGQSVSKADTAYVNSLLQKFDSTITKDANAALVIAEQAEALATKIDYKYGIAAGYIRLATYYDKQHNTPKRVEYITMALNFSRLHGIKFTEAKALNNLGVVRMESMDYSGAIASITKAMTIFREIHDTLMMANCYVNITSCFMNSKNYDEAIKYGTQSVQLFKQLHKTGSLAIAYNNMALMYASMRKYPESLRYADSSIHIFRQLKDTNALMLPYGIFGNYYSHIRKYDSAIYYFNKNLVIANHIGNKRELAFVYVNLGICCKELGKYKLAIQYFDTAGKLAHAANYRQLYFEIPHMLADLYDATHDYKKEAGYLRIAETNKDSILNEAKTKELADMTARFDNKELENKNALLAKDNDIKQIKLRQKNILVYSGFGAAALLLVIGAQVVRHNKLKANKKLLQVEQKQLLAQMNPHFIFNSLNSIQQFVVQNDTLNANKYLADFALLMRQTLDNSKDSTISLRRELDYLDNYLSFESMRFEDKFQYTLTCAEDIDPETVEIPSMIVQPFVENAIRHGLYNLQGKEGKLNIAFYKKEGYLICEVDDNGIGMEEAERIKSQRLIKHQSLGMDITRQRLELVSKMTNGDYNITVVNKQDMDQNPAGTTIIIKFPLEA